MQEQSEEPTQKSDYETGKYDITSDSTSNAAFRNLLSSDETSQLAGFGRNQKSQSTQGIATLGRTLKSGDKPETLREEKTKLLLTFRITDGAYEDPLAPSGHRTTSLGDLSGFKLEN